jgi:tRNA-dihydrouridine synthase B
MVETCDEDRPFAVQIFGADPIVMADAAVLLQERGVDSVDINMGCPVAKITKGGSGASMMCQTDETVGLVAGVVDSVEIPVTVKMRLGWDDTQLTAPMFARLFEEAGVAAVAIHGRTREQGFSGTVNQDGIRQVVEAVECIPVIANGDIRSVPDAAEMFMKTGCRAVSVGRGALANPWIFRQLQEWENTGSWSPAGSFDERMELLKLQFGFLETRHGSARAIILFRKMGHWYLKGMRVRKRLRGEYQQAKTRSEVDQILATISAEGPICGNRSGILTDVHVPVPSGPVARW